MSVWIGQPRVTVPGFSGQPRPAAGDFKPHYYYEAQSNQLHIVNQKVLKQKPWLLRSLLAMGLAAFAGGFGALGYVLGSQTQHPNQTQWPAAVIAALAGMSLFLKRPKNCPEPPPPAKHVSTQTANTLIETQQPQIVDHRH